ncbi:ATP-dependent RNA helicase, partial [Pseudoalteromonas sp. S3178]
KLTNALEHKDINFFNEVAAGLAEKLELSQEQLAGAMLCLAQQQTPLKVEDIKIQQRERRDRDDRRDNNRRGERNDRQGRGRERNGERRERPERERGPRNSSQGPMDTYRIEVGRDHGVQVKNIVGAIANEAD